MKDSYYQLRPIGFVRSPLTSLEGCPKQGFEGAPEAWLEIDPAFLDALDGLASGQEIIVLTWLDKGRRDLLRVHPRGNPETPLKGVFATRSPHRPNPIGLHRVRILEIQRPGRIRVRPLEALDGTPVIDIKPALINEGSSCLIPDLY
ncbi:MAG: tRNA (N6-threonylcarbamoyladenosine(37)-N6)-methyltransferase TrmO [Acidobacteriota bacterium]